MVALQVLALFSALTLAAPAPDVGATLHSRQADEACNLGYCLENGGTTGGAGGDTVTVSDVASLIDAAAQDGPLTIIVSGQLSGSDRVRVSSDKTIFGESGSSIDGVGFYVNRQSNVILRNLRISGVLADNGDAIGLQESTNIWVDHCDLSGDLNAGKDDLDGLLDITRAADWITVSNVYMHDHWKGSLIGHSDGNAGQDAGTLHITYANCHWYQINSRAPSIRFGTVHIVNNFWDSLIDTGVNCRMGAQVLVQSSRFQNSPDRAIFLADSDETGYAVVDDVDLGGSSVSVPEGNLTPGSLPYPDISPVGSGNVADAVVGTAGQNL